MKNFNYLKLCSVSIYVKQLNFERVNIVESSSENTLWLILSLEALHSITVVNICFLTESSLYNEEVVWEKEC